MAPLNDDQNSWYGGSIYPLDANGNMIDEEPDARIDKSKHGRTIVLCVVLMVVAALAIVGKLSGLF